MGIEETAASRTNRRWEKQRPSIKQLSETLISFQKKWQTVQISVHLMDE
jgi:hypothetical protein